MSQLPPSLFVMQNGLQTGPFPSESVAEMVRVGTFAADDYGWGEGMAEWRPLRELFPPPASSSPCSPSVPQGRSRPGQPYVPLPPKPEEERLTFGQYVSGAFTFPFRGDGLLVLVSGSLFFGILGALVAVGQIPIIAAGSMGATKRVFVLGLFLVGYLSAMIISVIQTTAHGEHTVPSWPDFGSWWDDIIDPAVKCFALLLVCFGPGTFSLIAGTTFDASQTVILGYGLLLVGAIYFPMALLALSLLDSLWAINPRIVLSRIFAVLGQYIIVLALTAGAILAPIILETILYRFSANFVWYGVVGWLVSLASLWAAFFVARILGGLYRANHNALAL